MQSRQYRALQLNISIYWQFFCHTCKIKEITHRFPRASVSTSGKTVSNSKNPGINSGCEFISSLSHFTIPPSPQSSAGTCTAKAATAMLIYTPTHFKTIKQVSYAFMYKRQKVQQHNQSQHDTCVLTLGGPLWNFFSNVCI